MSLERRVPLNRASEGARRFAAQRSRLPNRSRRQAKKDREYTDTRQEALDRDSHTCKLAKVMDGHHCTTWLPLQTHHMLPRSRGGVHDPGGLVSVCAGGHAWIDEHPREAELFGFLVSDKWRAIRESEEEAS